MICNNLTNSFCPNGTMVVQILQYDFRTKRRKESVATSSEKIVPVHPATNGRRLAEPILSAARSSPQLGDATPRRFLAAQARGSSRPAGRRARP